MSDTAHGSSSNPGNEASKQILESRTVFIDTSEFERLSFGFESGLLKILCEHPRIRLILSEVVVHEISDHLQKAASESVRLHKSFSDSARIMRTLGGDHFRPFFERFSAEEVHSVLDAAFRRFLATAEIETVPISMASSDDVFGRYFSNQAPFASGKKKSEFPDAFALEAIRQWAVTNTTKVYVISRDQGMKDYCAEVAELIYVESLEVFLDMAVREDQEAAVRIKTVVESNRHVFEERLDRDFPMLGFYVEERDGEVEDVTVTGAEIHESLIVELKDSVATVEFEVSVDFSASVTYDDLENAPYDSETKSLIVLDQVSEEWEREFEGTARMKLRVDPRNPESFEIEEFTINDEEDIGLVYDDGWPYK